VKSIIYRGELMHARTHPVRHVFHYPLDFYGFDLAELPQLDRALPLFGYNRWRPVAIHDRDYLEPGSEPIAEKLARVLAAAGRPSPARATLVTAARFFGHVFNPASFFFCRDAAGGLDCVVVQVRNTFGDMHLYLLPGGGPVPPGYAIAGGADKVFHVSPFFPRSGSYEFLISEPSPELDVVIRYRDGGRQVFAARLRATARPLTGGAMLRTIARRPVTAWLSVPRIVWQAARLRWQRRLPVFTRPEPASPMTVRRAPAPPPGPLERIGRGAILAFYERIARGRLRVELPEGAVRTFGGQVAGRFADLRVRRNAFFRRTLFGGEIGFGESFVAGDWESSDLPGLLCLLAEHLEEVNRRHHVLAAFGAATNRLLHRLRPNTVRGSRRNIGAHYDLSNEFFALFLDPTLTYSCAVFAGEGEDLEAAQRRKLALVAAKAGIGPDDHVLEIGCGWGSFAIETARATGCRLTGVTVSREQHELASARVREAGLVDRVELRLLDWRHVTGRFSRIVSIEMLESVGHENLAPFFRACARLLAPGGRAVFQVISIPDGRYETYRRESDWIRKHVFPGGHLPSLGVLRSAVAAAGFAIEGVEDIGLHYATTLRRWRERLLARRAEAFALGFDERALRLWEYYFSYCEAGFATGVIHDFQLALSPPAETVAP
jgi:cyclopropane-fatty-acyl-phospholipid synthase